MHQEANEWAKYLHILIFANLKLIDLRIYECLVMKHLRVKINFGG